NGRPMRRPESRDEADDRDENALHYRDRRATEGAAHHDLHARDRSYQRLFEKAKLAIPEQTETREDRREQYGHADDAGRDKLQVVAVSGALEHRPQAEAEDQQVENGIAERGNDLHTRAQVPLQFAQPENINHLHRLLHILANWRSWSVAPADSSRMVEPVRARNASSRDSVPERSLISFGVPCATSLP